ncbi:MAG: hypothetical protein K2X86_13815 [Cytophagaceae bacterium]|nr:hypothetical protein [Cytophagaceae bacterium]
MELKIFMKIIPKKEADHELISENTQYNFLRADHLTLAENITVMVYGIIEQSITVKKGATLHLHGFFRGVVHNEGGEFFLYQN